MSKENNAADFIALTAILIAIISGSMNFNQHQEIKRLSAINNNQSIQIEAMERTLLMNQ